MAATQGHAPPETDRRHVRLCGCLDDRKRRTIAGCVTLLNFYSLAYEVGSPWQYWWAVNAGFLAFYTLEFILRHLIPPPLVYVKATWLSTLIPPWLTRTVSHVFDVSLLVFALFETVVDFTHAYDQYRPYLQIIRLGRVFILVRQFDCLSQFVDTLASLMPSLSWIFGVMFLVWYVVAVGIHLYVFSFCSHDRLLDPEHDFGDLTSSLFSLFQVMTLDRWVSIAQPLFKHNNAWRLFFVAFIAFCSWIMISILTGVLASNFLSQMPVGQNSTSTKRDSFVQFLTAAFEAADRDENGVLDREEYAAMVESDVVTFRMRQDGAFITQENLLRAFDLLDVDKSGYLSLERFVEGLLLFQQHLGVKQFISVDYALRRMNVSLMDKTVKMTSQADFMSAVGFGKLATSIEELTQTVQLMRDDINETLTPSSPVSKSNRTLNFEGKSAAVFVSAES